MSDQDNICTRTRNPLAFFLMLAHCQNAASLSAHVINTLVRVLLHTLLCHEMQLLSAIGFSPDYIAVRIPFGLLHLWDR